MPFFSNSLELRRRMCKLRADPQLLEDAFRRLEHFKKRFHDEIYMLMSASQIDADALAQTLAQALGTPHCPVTFFTNEQCSAMDSKRQMEVYELARMHSVQRYLQSDELGAFANTKEDGRRMVDVIKGAVGTRRLTHALDNTFGNSFASVFKRNIVAVWLAYFHAFVPRPGTDAGNIEGIQWLGKLVDYLTKTMPAVLLAERPQQWICLTDH